MIKMIYCGKNGSGKSMEAFKAYYLEHHAPLFRKTALEVRRYVINFPIERPGREAPFDFVTEIWWDDMESFERAGASPEQAEAWADVANYAKTTGTFWLAREHIQIPPPIVGPGLLASRRQQA